MIYQNLEKLVEGSTNVNKENTKYFKIEKNRN